jgi:hypothetical protein
LGKDYNWKQKISRVSDAAKRAENREMKKFGGVLRFWHGACFNYSVEHQSGRIPPGHYHTKQPFQLLINESRWLWLPASSFLSIGRAHAQVGEATRRDEKPGLGLECNRDRQHYSGCPAGTSDNVTTACD